MKEAETYLSNTALLLRYKNGDESAKQELVRANLNLVTSISFRFKDRGQELEDIIEVGKIGLIKAIEGFKEELGYSFSTYAFPMICGEIKRFLRDDGLIKVSRATKRNATVVLRAKEQYIMSHGKEPKISDLCSICGLSKEDILECLSASNPVLSLDSKAGSDEKSMTVADTVADEDTISRFTDEFALRQAVNSLPDFERKLIELRYYRQFTQVNTAKVLGVSQVTVSRCEKKILERLRREII